MNDQHPARGVGVFNMFCAYERIDVGSIKHRPDFAVRSQNMAAVFFAINRPFALPAVTVACDEDTYWLVAGSIENLDQSMVDVLILDLRDAIELQKLGHPALVYHVTFADPNGASSLPRSRKKSFRR